MSIPVGPFSRSENLNRLAASTPEDPFDVVVIGGGITGAGVVLDAAARGLRAALIERDDFASGTSSKSSKLVHGGLRYLQQGEIGLVYEALHERQRLLANAPHLVELLPFLIPMFGKDGVIPPQIARLLGSVMWGYDLTGGFRVGKFHKRVTRDQALEYYPTLPPKNLVSGYLYFDCTADDARLVLAVLRTAAFDHAATIANGVAAVGLERGSDGKVRSVSVDADGRQFPVYCRSVVNAAGVWSDQIRTLDEGRDPDSIRPAKGIHITVPHHLVGNTIAAVIPVRGDKRSIFVVPHGEVTYIGTTDTEYDGPLDDPQCTPEDIDYLLKAVNAASVNTLTTADILGSWAGLRPLVNASSGTTSRTADLSRRHRVNASAAGVVTITGGKLTTYRRMAADTVDAVVRDVLGDAAPAGTSRSVTKKLRLRGADGWDTMPRAAAGFPQIDPAVVEHLTRRYGGEARAVLGLVASQPELGEPLVAGSPYLAAEAVFAVRFEMARSVDDVLSRRTRARIYFRDASVEAAQRCAELIAPEFGWSAAEAAESAAAYCAAVELERTTAELPLSAPAAAPDPASTTAGTTASATDAA